MLKTYRRVWWAVSSLLTAVATTAILAGAGGSLARLAPVLAMGSLLSSPWVLNGWRRWLRSFPVATAARLDAVAGALTYACPGYVAMPARRTLAEEVTDEELCEVWRTSTSVVISDLPADRTMRAVVERERWLDEFERLHPAGLRSWLVSPTAAQDDPLVYLADLDTGQGEIQWDDLIRGQDC